MHWLALTKKRRAKILYHAESDLQGSRRHLAPAFHQAAMVGGNCVFFSSITQLTKQFIVLKCVRKYRSDSTTPEQSPRWPGAWAARHRTSNRNETAHIESIGA